jgi:hypothetical protein
MNMDDYFAIRVEQIGVSILNKNTEYIKAGEQQLQLIREIKSLLPKEHRHLIMNLNDLANRQSAIAECIMFEQGFNDYKSYK